MDFDDIGLEIETETETTSSRDGPAFLSKVADRPRLPAAGTNYSKRESGTVVWESDIFRRCVVVGGSGAVGGMFAELLSRSGIAVCVIDGEPPPELHGLRFAAGNITYPSVGLISELANADLIMLAVPETVALVALPAMVRAATPGALLTHTLSVQSRMADALAAEAAGFEAVGLNPMFAPSLGIAGRPVAAAVVQDGPKVEELLRLVSAWGGQVVRVDAHHHDRLTATSQALTHAAVLAFGFALAELDADIAELSAVAPPPLVTMLALLARVASGTPEVYWDVQAANPHAHRARAALCAGARRTAELTTCGATNFTQSLDQLKQLLQDQRGLYLGRCAEIFGGPSRMADLREMLDEALARPAAQQPAWPDDEEAISVREILEQLPPITAAADIDRLRVRLSEVALGHAFVLQGGDCAETFAGNTKPHIAALITTLNQMAADISLSAGTPVVRIARLAGQYAKPRSAGIDSSGLPVYRGDIINSSAALAADRTPDPFRMLLAYSHACSTMRQLDQLLAGEIFVSHEALLLEYERALLRFDDCAGRSKLYDLSSHFLWVGERTRQIDGAHIALAEMLTNPIGIKIGPVTSPALAAQYVERLDPDGEPGRVTLISRMGWQQIRDVLPPIVEKVSATGHKVVWQCDPMHGNTEILSCGRKTRRFEKIADELCGFFEVHRQLGTHAGGVHLEMTGDDVTECLGGAQDIRPADLGRRYETVCDPRLNGHQAAELGNVIAEMVNNTATVTRI